MAWQLCLTQSHDESSSTLPEVRDGLKEAFLRWRDGREITGACQHCILLHWTRLRACNAIY